VEAARERFSLAPEGSVLAGLAAGSSAADKADASLASLEEESVLGGSIPGALEDDDESRDDDERSSSAERGGAALRGPRPSDEGVQLTTTSVHDLDSEDEEDGFAPLQGDEDDDEGDHSRDRGARDRDGAEAGMDLDDDRSPADDDEDEGVERGAEPEASDKDWHERTLRMMQFCQQNLQESDSFTYQDLAARSRRRIVASLFFEILQLKTWDRIHLHQDEPYSSIAVSRGPKFDDPIPNARS